MTSTTGLVNRFHFGNCKNFEAERWSFESNLFHEEGRLHPIEQGYFYKKLNDKGVSHEKIADEFKISRSMVTKYQSLTKLSPEIQEIFGNKLPKFKLTYALQIVRLAPYDKKNQKEIWEKFQSIRDSKKRTEAELERLVNQRIKEIKREQARIKELEEILQLYWNQDPKVIAELRGRFEKLGYNNDQIRGEILRLNERHQILILQLT